MINMAVSRSLSKRVQKLEARLISTEERMVIRSKYFSPDGSVKDGPLHGIGASPKTPQRSRRIVPDHTGVGGDSELLQEA